MRRWGLFAISSIIAVLAAIYLLPSFVLSQAPAAPTNLRATTPSVIIRTLTVSKSGSGSGTVTGTGISCGSDCSHNHVDGTAVTLTASPDAGSTFTGWTLSPSGACSGIGLCNVVMNIARGVTATFNIASSSEVLLEDFITLRNSHNTAPGQDLRLWQEYPVGSQTTSIVSQRLQVVVPTTGTACGAGNQGPNPCIYISFFPYPYTAPGGFAKHYIKSGTWDANFNRLIFWAKTTGTFTGQIGSAHTFGTYSKPASDTDPNNQGRHFYHHLAGPWTANRWTKIILNRMVQHEVGADPNINHPENPTTTSVPPVNYFDGFTRFYVGDYPGTNNTTWTYDDFRFSLISGEPDTEIATLMAHYTGSRYEVSWQARKNVARTFEVRYKSTSMKPDAFLTGTNGGTTTSPGSAFGGTFWSSPNIAEMTDIYVAIRVQGQTAFSEIHLPLGGLAAAVANPLALPVATTAHTPLITAYNALNVPNLVIAGSYLDPRTSVKVYRITNNAFPGSGASYGHDYSEGNNEISLPHTGTTRTILLRQFGGSFNFGRWLVDFTPGSPPTISNARQLTGILAPWSDIAFTFSSNPATPYYAYVASGDGSVIRRVDFRAGVMAEVSGGGWPVTGETQATWLHQSDLDAFFTWMRFGSTVVVGYEPSSGTKKTVNVADLDEPRIDRGGRYVGLTVVPANGLAGISVWDWGVNAAAPATIVWSEPYTNPSLNRPFAHVGSARRRWYGVSWDLPEPAQFSRWIPDVVQSDTDIGGPAIGRLIYGNCNWNQNPADLRDQWCLFHTYNNGVGLVPSGGGTGWLAPGGMVFITENGQRRLLGHPYNTLSIYERNTFAKSSPDGFYVIFTSDMNGSGRTDIFLAEVPVL